MYAKMNYKLKLPNQIIFTKLSFLVKIIKKEIKKEALLEENLFEECFFPFFSSIIHMN